MYIVSGLKIFVIVLICRRPITLVEGMCLAALFYSFIFSLLWKDDSFLGYGVSGSISIWVCLFGSMLKCRFCKLVHVGDLVDF